MSENKFEFEDDLHIDLNRLEWETARQAKLFGKWAKRWAFATKKRDRAQERVKTKRSELIKDVQGEWKDLGYVKPPTGPQEEAYYRTDEDYKQLKSEAIQAEFEVNMLYVAMRSLEHKRSSLGFEQKLYGDEYWSRPYEDPDFSEESQKEMEHQQEMVDKDDRIPKKSVLVRR